MCRLSSLMMDGFVTAQHTVLKFLLVIVLLPPPGLGAYQGDRQCPDGYFGLKCRNRCRGHCTNNRCYLLPRGRSVSCTEGCEKGWRGTMCSQTCRIGCRECERFSGECIGPCKHGYYRPGCSTPCPGNCRRCHVASGHCEGECPIGYYGVFCTNKCPCKKCKKGTGECLPVEPLSVTGSLTTVIAYYTDRITTPMTKWHHRDFGSSFPNVGDGDVGSDTNHELSIKNVGDGDVGSDKNNHELYVTNLGDGDVGSYTYNHGPSIRKLGNRDVPPKSSKHRSLIKTADDNDAPRLPPHFVVLIIVISVSSVIALVAVPFLTMGRFSRCAKKCTSQSHSPTPTKTSNGERMHTYAEIDETFVKDVLLSPDRHQGRMKTEFEHNEEYPQKVQSDQEMCIEQEARDCLLT